MQEFYSKLKQPFSFFPFYCCFSLLLLVFAPMLGAIELSPEEREYLHKKETIVFVSQTRYPPFEFINALGQQEGIMHDIIHWISMEAGFKPVFMDMTFQKAQKAVLDGGADILTSLFYSDKRNESFEFTQPLFDVPASIFVRAQRTDIKELNDLKGKIIAIQQGDYAKDFLEARKIMFQVMETSDFAEAVDRVVAGKADAVIGDEQIVYYHIFSNRLTDNIKTLGEPLYIGKNCMASRKGNAVLIGILNKGFIEARRSGVLEKIVKKWLGTKYAAQKSVLEIYLWPIGLATGIILLLSVGVWIWNARLRSLVRQKTEIILHREESLRVSEENFRKFFNNNPAPMAVSGALDRKITDVNEAFLHTLGFSRVEVIGRTSAELNLIVQPERQLEIIKQLQLDGGVTNCELQVRCKDGTILDGLFSAELIESKKRKSVLTVMIDQTARKRVEEEVRRSREELDEIFCMSIDGICIADINTATFLKINPAFTRILGYSEADLLQRPFLDFIHPEDVAPTATVIHDKLQRGEKVINFTNRYRCADGTYRWLEWVSHPSAERGITFAVAHDITERKRAEEELKKSEALYHDLVETSQDLIWQCDAEGRYTYLNPAWEHVFGYKLEEMLGRKFTEFQTVEMANRDQQEFIRLMQGGSTKGLETIHLGKDGNEIHLVFNAKFLSDENGRINGTRGTAYDITKRRQMEEAYRQETEFNRLVINNAGEGICVCHEIEEFPHVCFTVWNDCMTSITGYSVETINRYGWYQSVYPDPVAQAKAVERMQRMRLGDNLQGEEWEITRSDGEKRQLLITTRYFVLEKGQVHVLGVMNDITERKIAEKKQAALQEQTRRLQKAESLGRMAASIAHHFNNMLSGIMGNMELAMNTHPDDHDIRMNLTEAMKAARKAAELSGLMLTYIGQSTCRFESVDLMEVCRSHQPVLQAAMSPDLMLETELLPASIFIQGNAGQIKQILTQLLNNAREALADGQGKIRLSIRTIAAADIPTMNRFPLDWHPQQKLYACLEVSDTGCGIPPRDIENLFDPFFSSKLVGRGLGLAVILGIVRIHRGAVVVTSLLGQGSIFQVFLPVSEAAGVSRPDPIVVHREFKGKGGVLLVEDEEVLRKLTARMLERLGFSVLQAKDGLEALELFQQHQADIRLVLCDLTMPRMNGWETLAALRELSSDIPVILASGYDENSAMQGAGSEQSFQAFLHKPFVLAELAAVMGQALGQVDIFHASARQPERS